MTVADRLVRVRVEAHARLVELARKLGVERAEALDRALLLGIRALEDGWTLEPGKDVLRSPRAEKARAGKARS